jgi:hypothetical protein
MFMNKIFLTQFSPPQLFSTFMTSKPFHDFVYSNQIHLIYLKMINEVSLL